MLEYLPKKMAGRSLSLMIKNNRITLYITDLKSYKQINDTAVGPSFMGQHPSVQIFPK